MQENEIGFNFLYLKKIQDFLKIHPPHVIKETFIQFSLREKNENNENFDVYRSRFGI